MRIDWNKKSLATAVVTTSLVLTGCGGGSSAPDAPPQQQAADVNFNGPGSKWDFRLGGDGSFEIERRDDLASPVDMTVAGNWTRLSTGFLHLSVVSATGDDAPEAGDTAWAIEVPGYALFLAPIREPMDQIIPMVTAGNCPSSDMNANWIMVRKEGADAQDAERDFIGTFSYVAATNSPSLPEKYALENFTELEGLDQLGAANCQNGIMELDNADAVMYLTDNGGAIVHTGVTDIDDSSFIFAFTKKAITAVNNLDGEYAGVLFDDNLDEGNKIAPVSVSCDSGVCTGDVVTDIETGATTGEPVTLNLSGTPDGLSQGFITGTIDNGGAGVELACMADISVGGGDRKMVNCVGQSPGDASKMFNVIFTSL